MSLSFLKAILKSLKQAMSKGCNAWVVCEGKITIFNPNVYVCSIASKVTWDPWPSKMNRCLFIKKIPLSIHLLKKKRNSLKKDAIIHAFDYIAILVPNLQN